ncbi:dTDP-4-dehydrorhamnose reductase [Palleronia sediminis]|uniref:dTDP-4-dehydrorhamnose reductase n=1 Tax=Palleronia sediminis TaxID=2547833 RepID=A0A4R6AD70_9RHOB|nr:dTDP-4-dehydrorhamnose reductase [Palleronia sediminis]TDL81137.1 dTDP-4-dehydrorhamnose reductase [Palleronia sediminis]
MKVLVFGKTGQVARALARHRGVTCLDRAAADLSDPGACARIVAVAECDAVVNAAAWTAVDAAETQEGAAHVVNAEAPAAMAGAAARRGLPFVHVSTDYVFDGSGTDPWRPDSPTGPLNAYGRSKLAGERGVRAAGGAVIRTSWVFSDGGRDFVGTILRAAAGGDSIRVVDDQIGGPTPAEAVATACLRVAEALSHGHPPGIWHVAGAPFISWAGFARAILAAAGRDATVEPIASAAWPTPARRPLNSRLDCSATEDAFGLSPPDWRAALERIVTKEPA